MIPPPRWISACGLLLTAAIVGIPVLPLGIPGEWTWPRHAFPETVAEGLDRLTGSVLAVAILLTTAMTGGRLLRRRGAAPVAVTAAGLFVVSLLCSLGLPSAAPEPHRTAKGLWVLYDRAASGYFLESAFHVSSPEALLSGYEARMRRGDVLHEGTHPPGLYLANTGLLQLTAAVDGLPALVSRLVSSDATQTFRSLEAAASMAPRLKADQFAALVLAVAVSRVLASLAPVAIFGLALLLFDRATAWRAGCLTIVIPALHIFFPKSDVVFATTATVTLALGTAGFVCRRLWLRMLTSTAGGAVLFLGMLLSLAHLPVVMVYGLTAALIAATGRGGLARALTGAASLTAAFVFCTSAFSLRTDCDLLRVWLLNLDNHAAFYDAYPRTAWKWLLINPVELAVAAGLPVFLAAVISGVQVVRSLPRALRAEPPHGVAATSLLAAMAITVVALWLSARNSGEAARLWCFLMPWLALLAAQTGRPQRPDPASLSEARFETPFADSWRWLLTCQALSAILVVGRVSGFLQL